ncbi:uncharacterized protein LOC116853783 [Odontomachus brunneus]|uniref:uncharacterized protein LOC116853783 n=1 Tax=Odontomachus brunneus TaxID=486640 RepID=UPI0013F28349|nr:uncharacterized protein LOC116853783 [Odontomachus brunneus]
MIKSLRLLGLRWACKFGHKLCKEAATVKLSLFVTYPSKILPWWKEWIYCAGMMDASPYLWNQFLGDQSGIYSQENLTYLACTEHENLPFHYLNLLWTLKHGQLKILNSVCTDPEKSYEIIFTVYRSFVKKHARKNAVLKYILDHYSRLSST